MRGLNVYEKMPVNSVSDLTAMKLDQAGETQLYFGDNRNELKDWKLVYNMTRDKPVIPVSSDYQLIQNSDVINAVGNTLSRLNLDVKGVCRNLGNSFTADLIFQKDGLPVVKDDAEGIKLGIRVINSYNKTASFRLEMFGFRSICQNGMTFGAKSFGVVETTIHYGNMEKNFAEISKITERFVNRLIESSATMQAYVNDMIGDSLEYESAVTILKAMVKQKKHSKFITEQIEGCKTRWDLYNALTHYATHNEALSPGVMGRFEALSRKVMETTSEGLIAYAQSIPEEE